MFEKLTDNKHNTLVIYYFIDNIGFQNAFSANTEQSYELFISKYPNSIHLTEAKAKMESASFFNAKKLNQVIKNETVNIY